MAEAITSNLAAVGIRMPVRTMERAAFLTAWREKKLRASCSGPREPGGNAATRVEAVTRNGLYASGVPPEVEDLFQRQARERDRRKREELLHRSSASCTTKSSRPDLVSS